MRSIPKFLWPASKSGRLLVLFCAGLLTVALTVALVDHPLAYALRVKAVSLFAGEPGVALDFQREPADRPVLTSGTAETPLLDLANIIEVKRTDDQLILFTTLAGKGEAHRGERIGYHTSRAGSRWSRPREVVSSLPAGFDSWGCMPPTVVREADRWVLFYTALENSRERPSQRWGIPLGQDGWLFGTLGRAESITPKSSVSVR